jgi:ferredoxin-thioredoxin reductase catalytic subunit
MMTEKEIVDYIHKNAKELYYVVNEEMAPLIAKGLQKKLEKFGELYCPCVLVRDENTICPCNDFKNSSSRECHCKLYFKNI